MTRQLERVTTPLSSSQTFTDVMYEPESRGRGGGRNSGGRGKKNVAVGTVEEVIIYYNVLRLS